MKIPWTNYEFHFSRAEKRPRPDDWDDFWYERQPFQSSTGIDVDDGLAMTYFAVWACRKIISEDMGSIPLFVYQRDGDTRKPARDHYLFGLLHDAPNPEMSAMQFREALQDHLLGMGNAYAQKVLNMRGQVRQLWPLDPTQMSVERDENNELIYKYQINGGETKIFPRDEIFHIAGLSINGIVGLTPLKYHAEIIGTGIAEQQFHGNTFKNGAKMSVVFVHPGQTKGIKTPGLDSREQVRKELEKVYSGTQNAGRIGVTWEGMEPKPISMSLHDAEFIESRKLTWLQICSIYRVPPHKVMYLFQATYSNIENQDIGYAKDTIRPWATRWEQAINTQLIGNPNLYFAEHNLEGLIRGDIKSRYDAYAIGRQWGWLSANDIRKLENMNPIADGDVYLQPMNMSPAGDFGDMGSDEPTVEETAEAARAIKRLRLIRSRQNG